MTTNLDEYKGAPSEKPASTASVQSPAPENRGAGRGSSSPKLAVKGSFRDMLNHSVGKFLFILDSSGKPEKIEALCASFTKRMDNLINIFDPWDQFLTNVNFFRQDETEARYLKMSERLQECLTELLNPQGCIAIIKAFSTSDDFKIRNMLVRDILNPEITKRFGSQDFIFDVVAENLAEKVDKPQESKKAASAPDRMEEKANFSFITVTPVIDPVKGLALSQVKPGDHILVEGPHGVEKISCPVASISPSEIEGRLIVYVNVEGNVMGKMVLSRTTMLARPEDEKPVEVGKDMVWFIIVAVFLILAFIFSIVYSFF